MAQLFCAHDNGQCTCRKPHGDTFEQAITDFPEISAAESVMIGDSKVDIDFGQQLHMKTIFMEGDAERHGRGAEATRQL